MICMKNTILNAKIRVPAVNYVVKICTHMLRAFRHMIVVFYWPISLFILLSHLICKISIMYGLHAFYSSDIAWVPNTETPKLEGAIFQSLYKVFSFI